MADQGNQAGHDSNTDNIAANQLHHLADDHVKHTGIGHNTEVQNGENEQGCGRTGAGETGLDQGSDVIHRHLYACYRKGKFLPKYARDFIQITSRVLERKNEKIFSY